MKHIFQGQYVVHKATCSYDILRIEVDNSTTELCSVSTIGNPHARMLAEHIRDALDTYNNAKAKESQP